MTKHEEIAGIVERWAQAQGMSPEWAKRRGRSAAHAVCDPKTGRLRPNKATRAAPPAKKSAKKSAKKRSAA